MAADEHVEALLSFSAGLREFLITGLVIVLEAEGLILYPFSDL